MYTFDCKINRAVYRLNQIADGEAVMGYSDSATVYRETAVEIGVARLWVQDIIQEMIAREAK